MAKNDRVQLLFPSQCAFTPFTKVDIGPGVINPSRYWEWLEHSVSNPESQTPERSPYSIMLSYSTIFYYLKFFNKFATIKFPLLYLGFEKKSLISIKIWKFSMKEHLLRILTRELKCWLQKYQHLAEGISAPAKFQCLLTLNCLLTAHEL